MFMRLYLFMNEISSNLVV